MPWPLSPGIRACGHGGFIPDSANGAVKANPCSQNGCMGVATPEGAWYHPGSLERVFASIGSVIIHQPQGFFWKGTVPNVGGSHAKRGDV